MSRTIPRAPVFAGAVLCLGALLPIPAAAQNVDPGIDLFVTDDGTTFRDFGPAPIPADFFGPGSDPFDGIVALQGSPLGSSPLCPLDELLDVDTMIDRLQPAILPGIPSSAMVEIQMVELSLVSIDPIEITYWGGMDTELWNVEVTLSAMSPSLGLMSVIKTHPNGGVFSSELYVYPRLIFTQVAGPEVRIWDLGDGGSPDAYNVFDVPWEYSYPPVTSCTSNFCVNPGGLTVYQSLTADHGLRSICPLDDPRDVDPGCDLFVTDVPSTFRDFQNDPLPADFFGPGSDPFDGTVAFAGSPLGTSPHCPFDDLSIVDTIIERLQPAILPTVPAADQIDIELVELSLVSTTPITVTYDGGMFPELWDVEMSVSSLAPSLGSMQIQRLTLGGGSLTAGIDLCPLFIFTRQSDAEVRILDYGYTPSFEFIACSTVPWIYHVPPPNSCTSNFCVNPGGLTVFQGNHTVLGLRSVCPSAVGVGEFAQLQPGLYLAPSRPNPMHTATRIAYRIPADLDGEMVRLDLFDVMGRRVRNLVDGPQPFGMHGVTWDGTDGRGMPVAGGVYFYRLTVGAEHATGRVVFLR